MNYLSAQLSRILFLAAFILLPLLTTAQRKNIWIDTDIHLGRFGRDVDDGIAVLQALRSDKVAVKGISLTLDVDYGYQVTQKLTERCSKVVPIYKGAKSYKVLGKETEAVKALTEALSREKLSILVLGPMTNIASVIRLHPELKSQIQEVVFCGGRQPGERLNPGNGKLNLLDVNFERDPTAFQLLFETDIPIVLAGYEASSTIYFDKDDIQFLKVSSDKTDRWLYKKMRNWQKLWKITLGSTHGFIPFDAVTLSWLTNPDYLLYYPDIPASIEQLPNDSRLFKLAAPHKPYLQVSYNYPSSRTVQYCYGVQPALKESMLYSLKKPSHPDIPINPKSDLVKHLKKPAF